MSVANQLKHLSMPKIDDVLAYSGLQRSPSTVNRLLTGFGLVSLGAVIGAGVTFWLSSPKSRKELKTTLTHGIDKVAETIGQGLPAVTNGAAMTDHDPRVVVR